MGPAPTLATTPTPTPSLTPIPTVLPIATATATLLMHVDFVDVTASDATTVGAASTGSDFVGYREGLTMKCFVWCCGFPGAHGHMPAKYADSRVK